MKKSNYIKISTHIILFFVSFLYYGFCFSQQKIGGYIKNDEHSPIYGASVRLLDAHNKIISFTSSDEKGFFEITCENENDYTLEVKHISHSTYRQKFKPSSIQSNLEIVLAKSYKEIEEVVIASPNVARQKGDTIKYNLKALTTGNEQKLEDVIKKLPGLSINENGKITSKGKVVDELMINGKNFFGNNHQIATENISANMLEGIELLNNHESFKAIKDIEESERTSLNIKIKKEYLGKITGEIDAFLAYKEKYSTHSSLFRFLNKTNITAVVDVNNTGKQALSVADYIHLNKGISSDIRNTDIPLSDYIQKDWIPDFLAKKDDLYSKKSKFVAVDIFHQVNDKTSINGYSLFNAINTVDKIYSQNTILNSNENNDSYENQTNFSDFLYNQTKLNLEYKPNSNNLLNYSVYYEPQEVKNDIFTSYKTAKKNNNYTENIKNFSYYFGHQLSYIARISKNKLLSFGIYQDIKNQNNNYNLSVDTGNIFTLSGTEFLQDNKLRKNELGILAKYTHKIGKNVFKFNAGASYNNQYFSSENLLNISEKDTKFEIKNLFSGISITKRVGFFQYIAKLEARNYLMKNFSNKKNIFRFLPSTEIKFNFTDLHNITFSYNKSVDFLSVDNINKFYYAKDFRTLYSVSSANFYDFFKKDNYSFTYLNMDLYTGTLFFISSILTKSNENISNNIMNKGDFSEIINCIIPNYKDITSYFIFEQRIKPLKNRFKLDFTHSYNENMNYINGYSNKINSNIYDLKVSFVSKFKNNIFNYNAGIDYNFEKLEYEKFSFTNEMKKISPFVNFNGKISEKNIRYFIYNSYEIINAKSSKTEFYNLGAKLIYDKKTEKFKYWLECKNILNLNNSKVIGISSDDNIFSIKTISRLTGYMGLGISREF